MYILVSLCFTLINCVVCLKNFKNGLLLYLVLSLVLPNFKCAGVIISYELFSFIPLFIFFLLLIRRNKIKISLIHIILFGFLVLTILATLLSSNKYNTSILWISLMGQIRIVLLIFIISQFAQNRLINNFFLIVMSVNLCLSFIQVIYPESINIFYNLYYKESLTPLSSMLELGRFSRATGSFGSPIHLGAFALIGCSYYLSKLLDGFIKPSMIYGLIAAILCGVFSTTKTFYLGFPTVLFCAFFIKGFIAIRNVDRWKFSLSKGYGILFVAIFMLITVLVGVKIADEMGIPVYWYANYLSNPLESFSTRFDINAGNLRPTLKVVEENFLIGVGDTQPYGEFIGDSFYVVILHNSGLIGAFILFLLLLTLLYKAFRTRDLGRILLVFSLFLSGLSYPSVMTLLGAVILSYVDSNKKALLSI